MRTIVMICFAAVIISCNEKTESPSNKANDTSATTAKAAASARKTILFFGNSITAGYGLDQSDAFPARIQEKIDSMDAPYKVINAGVSGETSSGGNSRIDWILKQPVDIFVLELGGNDGLRGIPLNETKKNLLSIVDKVKAKNPSVKIIVAGMQIPPNMGKKYTTEFRSMYPELANRTDSKLIPFILEGVGGRAELNLEDGIHPTAEGHKILANNVWGVLRSML